MRKIWENTWKEKLSQPQDVKDCHKDFQDIYNIQI